MKSTKDIIWGCQFSLRSNQFITQKISRIRAVRPSACMHAFIEGMYSRVSSAIFLFLHVCVRKRVGGYKINSSMYRKGRRIRIWKTSWMLPCAYAITRVRRRIRMHVRDKNYMIRLVAP
jgi:hypothetical protein